MFPKSFRAPFYFYAGEDGGAAGGSPVVTTVVTPAPAGTPGAAAAPAGALGTPPIETPPAAVVDTTKKAPEGDPKPAAKPGEAAPKDPPKEGAKSAADGGGTPTPETKIADWPEDWRAKLAGDDKKLLSRLERMKDPKDVLNAWRAIEVDMSSGKLAKKLPTHYTAEELADFKKSNGIPDKPEGYDTNIGGGIVWGESDKQHIENFTNYALEHNMTPEEVKRGLGWWAQYQEALVGQQDQVDANNSSLAQNELRALWGGNVNRNLNFVKNMFEGEKGAWSEFVNARGPDGKRLGDNPTIMKFMFQKFQEGDPQAVDLPGNGSAPADPAKEKADMMPLVSDKSSAYWKGPQSAAMQARYRDLIEGELRAKARAGG